MGAEATEAKIKQDERIETLDGPREYLSVKFVDLVRNIDRYFGSERNYQESNESVLQIDTTRMYGYNGNDRIELTGRAKLHLPYTEKRLHLIVESNPDQNLTGENAQNPNAALNNKVSTPESYGAGLRFERAKEGVWHFSTDAGIQFEGIKLDPFTRIRGSYTVPKDLWRLKTTETLFWFNTTGPGETTQFDAERLLSKPFLFRATSSATWMHDTQRLDLRQDATVFHTYNERTGLIYQASIFGFRQFGYQVTDFVMLITYRYRLHRRWIFFEFTPQLHFPKDQSYGLSPAALVRLEMMFDTKN